LLLLREVRRRVTRRARASADAESARTLALVGEALAASHEREVLFEIVLRAFVEASGAVAGLMREQDGSIIRQEGDIPAGTKPLPIDLEDVGAGSRPSVELYLAPGEALDGPTQALLRSLAGQARTALENAYLHRVVEQQAATDELTRLANRRRFLDSLSRERLRSERFGSATAVILMDIDDFKRVNDRYGHQAGDDVLVALADVVRAELRDVDLPARLGGEEFAILLPETDIEGATALAERIRSRLNRRRLRTRDGATLRVTASFGVAAHPASGSVADLLVLSDAALYRAKALGKNQVVGLPAGG
jgi:diguanylate cyclase (GGDEF)-like protein